MMRDVVRAFIVLAISGALGAIGWFALTTLGSPTPTPTRPGIDQPAIVGLEHTVQFLIVGAVVWLLASGVSKLVGGRKTK